MNRIFTRRVEELEKRQPAKPRRVVVIGPDDEAPADADFVIRLVAAEVDRT